MPVDHALVAQRALAFAVVDLDFVAAQFGEPADDRLGGVGTGDDQCFGGDAAVRRHPRPASVAVEGELDLIEHADGVPLEEIGHFNRSRGVGGRGVVPLLARDQ